MEVFCPALSSRLRGTGFGFHAGSNRIVPEHCTILCFRHPDNKIYDCNMKKFHGTPHSKLLHRHGFPSRGRINFKSYKILQIEISGDRRLSEKGGTAMKKSRHPKGGHHED